MSRIAAIMLILANFCQIAQAKMRTPVPIKADRDNIAAFIAISFIQQAEGLTLVHTKGLGHKELIIGYGDNICKKRYKNKESITKLQADRCLYEAVIIIYSDVKAKLPNLKPNQYAAIISLVFNVGYDNFYKSRLFKLIKYKSKNYKVIKREWVDFNHVDGKVVDGITKRRVMETDIFLNLTK